ncbi:MAG: class I SAM-dependent RNA methyltransferase [Actinomycetaceae bacterium]|nr:class I SAM-dependent RNA methyltransferase [Actinomycetaceae bacterium]MDY6083098.1 class I SAM-dependent RNA methyltransferase [Actinomycetaceae bacterium]
MTRISLNRQNLGEDVTLTLTDIANGGYAVGHQEDGRTVFARFGLPGETVRVALKAVRNKLAYGDVVRVHEHPHPARVEPAWEDAGPEGVGAAELSHVRFDAQAMWKGYVLAQSLVRMGSRQLAEHVASVAQTDGLLEGLDTTVDSAPLHVHQSERDTAKRGWHSRTRAEFVIDDAGRPAMTHSFSHELHPLTSLPIIADDAERLDVFSPSWRQVWQPGDRVRVVMPSGDEPRVVINRNQVLSLAGRPVRQDVAEEVILSSQQFHYGVGASDFWQLHREAPSRLIIDMCRALAAAEGIAPVREEMDALRTASEILAGMDVIELYAGSGLFSQPLAQAIGPNGRLRTWEGSRSAVAHARANLREFPWAHVSHASIDARFLHGLHADIVVADPPRSGLGTRAARALASVAGRVLVIAFCDIAACARDLQVLHEAGWQVRSFVAEDLFPNTPHAEIVVSLTKGDA